MCLASQLVIIRPSILIMYIFLISETVCRAKQMINPHPPQLQPLLLFKDTWHRWPCVRLWVSPQHNYVKKKKQAIRYTNFFDKRKGIDFEAVTNDFHNFYIVHKLSSSRTEEEYTRWRMSTGFEHLDRYVLSEYFSIVTLQYDFQAKIKDAPNEGISRYSNFGLPPNSRIFTIT